MEKIDNNALKKENMELRMKFAERLKSLRDERGMTLNQLGEKVGLSSSALSRYETGDMVAKKTSVQVISDFFGVNPAWLTGIEGVEKYRTPKKEFRQIPILGIIAAGIPILSQECIEGYESILIHERLDFCLRVKGSSMTGARIYDGDIVFVREQPDVENGEIAVVLIDDEEATLKRVYKIDGNIILHSENPEYKDMIFGNKDKRKIKILGKAMYFKSEIR